MSEEFLSVSRDKWRELPAGGETLGRTYSGDLLSLDDASLMAHWRRMNEAAIVPDVRGWFHCLYGDVFAGRRVVEVGSGFGFDGISFLTRGAHWTFSDLVVDNLNVVRRVVESLGLGERASYLHVENERSFAGLKGGPYDAVWAIGSLHHAPFDIARTETLDLLRHLKAGGRWIELTYPYERWLREGSLPFSEFGKRTDGERTPWAEWYDLEKVKRRLFPSRTTTILDFTTGGGNFGWVDLRVDEPNPESGQSPEISLMGYPATALNQASLKALPGEWRLVCPPHVWWYAMSIGLEHATEKLGSLPFPGLGYAVDLEIDVQSGSVGVVLADLDPDRFVGRERILDARPSTHRVTVLTYDAAKPAQLLVRNTIHGVASQVRIRSAALRFAA